MPKDVKNLVDEIVNQLEKHPKVAELYELWYQQKCAIIATYTNNYPPKEPLSENEVFRPIKNAVLEAAVGMGTMGEMTELVGDQRKLTGPRRIETGISGGEGINQGSQQELDQAIARIEREHLGTDESMLRAYEDSDGSSPSFRSIESFLYRVSKVFEDKRPVGNQGQAMDRKMYVRQAERKREMGMQ